MTHWDWIKKIVLQFLRTGVIMALLSDTGVHCNYSYCNQFDFLPLRCDACQLQFCKEHFHRENHECVAPSTKDKRVIVCPLCLDTIPLKADEDANFTLEVRHMPYCGPSQYAERLQKSKGATCPVRGCHERLTDISSFTCKQCQQNVCMKHRFPDDHVCRPESVKQPPKPSTLHGFRRKKRAEARFGSATEQVMATAAARQRSQPSSMDKGASSVTKNKRDQKKHTETSCLIQ